MLLRAVEEQVAGGADAEGLGHRFWGSTPQSKQFDELAEAGDRLGKTLAFQHGEEFLGCPGWVFHALPLSLHCGRVFHQ
jgi:hypothetical protein